jgi:hypothetical protein
VNQVAKIEKSLGRVFCPPHVPSCDPPREIVPPTDTDWVALPERFLDGITFASRFSGSSANQAFRFEIVGSVHCSNGKAYGTDNRTIVEFDMGTAPALYLTPKQIARIAQFGAPTHMSGERHCLNFKWANGNMLTVRGQVIENKSDKFCELFDAHDWDGFRKMDADWRDQIVGHFSYKPNRDNDGLIHFASDRIVGGRTDNHPDTQLTIETYVEQDVTFEQKQLLRALKVAKEFKFVHGDASYFLFKAENVRGFVVLSRPVDPVPVLS